MIHNYFMKIFILSFAFIILFTSCTQNEDNNFKTRKSESLRKQLIGKVLKFPKSWITSKERSNIISFLQEVKTVKEFTDWNPDDFYGGAINVKNQTLHLSPRFFTEDNFHFQSNLMITLMHESIHWNQLKNPLYSSLREQKVDFMSVEVLAITTVMEIEAYAHDLLITKRLNKLDPNYLLPVCYQFITEKQKIPDNPSNFEFGYGRALISLFNKINKNNFLTSKEKRKLYEETKKFIFNNFPSMEIFSNRGPVDCTNKHGGG